VTEHIKNIGLGTAAIGRPQYINLRQEVSPDFSLARFKEQGVQVLNEAYKQGIRYFDTASGYGLAEQLLIDWIKDKKYTDIEIATKWGYTYIANFNPNAKIHEVKELSLNNLNKQWEQSKKLLPYLKSYQIHSATIDSGVFENKKVLDRLGTLKTEYGLHIGLTTSGANQINIIKKALDIEIDGKALFNVFQVTYNIMDQSLYQIAKKLIAHNKRIVIKEALANGRIFPNTKYPHYAKLYQTLQNLSVKYKVGIDAIAIRLCMDSFQPYMVLSGALNKNQITQNLKAIRFKLDEKEITDLKQFSVTPDQYWNERKQLEWN
jgi:aryl-alcohol dehydrogenase-like predicted oxidoreductase